MEPPSLCRTTAVCWGVSLGAFSRISEGKAQGTLKFRLHADILWTTTGMHAQGVKKLGSKQLCRVICHLAHRST
jgi:hypothetical protein